MKQCPKCQRCYLDETLNFCLDDGDVLQDYMPMSDFPTEVMPHSQGFSESRTKLFSSGSSGGAAYAVPSLASRAANSIAVLPFAHLSSDPDDEYFCDGLAEEMINALAKIDGLRVAARTSAFSFKGKNMDIGVIGRQLGVDNVLEGSVRKSGNRLRITAQLIGTADGYHIWSERYDREMSDIFEVQDEIALAVVEALKTKLLGAEAKTEDFAALVEDLKHYRTDVEAYQRYLRGRFFLNKFTAENFYRALESFNSAITLDANYALAYAGIADAHILLAVMAPGPPAEAMRQAKDAALKALALDENLSEAHCSLGVVLRDYEYDFSGAEYEFQRSIELNPNNSIAYQCYGHFLAHLGRHEEAERQFKKALEVDPLSVPGNWMYGFGLFEGRRYDDCIKQTEKTLELDPNFPTAYLNLAFARQMKGDYADSVEAYATFSQLCGNAETASIIRENFESGGWEGFLNAMTAPEMPLPLSSYIVAVFHAAKGNIDGALAKLEESFSNREPHIVMLKVDPRFDDAIRNEQRFASLISKIGFPQ